jgi:hypothetical protein
VGGAQAHAGGKNWADEGGGDYREAAHAGDLMRDSVPFAPPPRGPLGSDKSTFLTVASRRFGMTSFDINPEYVWFLEVGEVDA